MDKIGPVLLPEDGARTIWVHREPAGTRAPEQRGDPADEAGLSVISEAVMGVATQTQLAGPIDRKGRDMLASLVRASRQDPSVWWAADDMIWEGLAEKPLSQERCDGYSREGLTGEKCPECGRVPDIGLNHVLRGMQPIVIDEEDLVHQKQLIPCPDVKPGSSGHDSCCFTVRYRQGRMHRPPGAARLELARDHLSFSAVACFPPFSFISCLESRPACCSCH